MNILNNFREFLATGQEQLLDIFEDNGQEKPKPVILYKYIWYYHDSFNENIMQEVKFASEIEVKAYETGMAEMYELAGAYDDFECFISSNKKQLIKEVKRRIKEHNEY